MSAAVEELTPVRTPWSDVSPGEIVEAKDGSRWDVLAFNADRSKVKIADAQGRPVILDAEGHTTALRAPVFPDVEPQAVAEALATVHLGAQLVAREQDGRRYCPASYTHVGSLQAHLYICHGMSAADLPSDLPTLRRLHDADHDAESKGAGFEEHVHDDAPFRS